MSRFRESASGSSVGSNNHLTSDILFLMPYLDLAELIRTVGYLGVFTIVFLESGLLIGFFFPGDSLLFTAGFLASQGYLDISILVIGLVKSCVLIFNKEKSIFFHKKHLASAQKFYDKHGGKTIILARFVPVIRAFAPVVAGGGKMGYKKVFTF